MWALGAALALTLAGAVLPWFEFGRAAPPLWAVCAAAGLLLWRAVLTRARQERRDRETREMLKTIAESLSKLEEEAAERRAERERAEEEKDDAPPPNATAEEIASFFGVELASNPESDS